MAEPPTPITPARVPPSNLRAEESVLGAMLLSREAIAEVVESLDPDHFYKPAHGHLYDAIMGLYGAGEPVDAVTVAEELQRASLLEEIGGPGLLLDLQASTPAISNASHYAKIVEEHALLRKLISVSNEIAEMAYGVPDDVIKAIDDAESRMFEVAQRRVTNTTAQIKDLLSANLDRLETLYERGDAITGTSTGYLDLDEMLAGLQPNALYVVGARPAMGKALALDTPLATPDGWITMGDVQVGDRVFDELGVPTKVTYKSPVFVDHDCFEVEFDDHSVIVADAEHQWFTWDDQASSKTRTTRELAATLYVPGNQEGEDRRLNHRVPVAGALDLAEAELAIDPYLLGVWLGNRDADRGHTSARSTTTDQEIIEAFAASAFTEHLNRLGLSDGATHIPGGYKRSSIKQRLALLHGLMDAEGSVTQGQTTCRLELSNEMLLKDARELVLSLGYKAGVVRQRRSNLGSDVWRFGFSAPEPVFRVEPKCSAQRLADRPNGKSRWRTIVAVRPVDSRPVQCITVDSPSHLYLAGPEMIPTHNTAFALGMLSNAAMKDQKPVLFFSLEMSQLELSQRILCSEALVDSSRIRTGHIEEPEWNRISHAVGRLAEAPIYIDDNPQTSVMEIRAKARRLKSRVGDLGMVVVDYIQLMSGRSNAESRQVEVSEISRGLKILARELEAPVVALAQLNRSLEQRVDKRPMLSDLRESGCMPASTRILRADGTEVTFGELLRSQETPDVWAVDDDGRIVSRRLLKTFPSGIKPVYRMRFASGREVEATDNHKFLTVDGWKPLEDLAEGSVLAAPRSLPEPADKIKWPEADVILLATDPHRKTIPEEVHRLSTDQIALFLRHLWATGGVLAIDRSVPEAGSIDGQDAVHCYFVAPSKDVALSVQRLLQRCDVRATVSSSVSSVPSVLVPPATNSNYLVSIEGQPDLLQYLTVIGGHGEQDGVVPEAIEILNQVADLNQAAVQNPVEPATSDIYWDELVAIEALGEQPVFDATVDIDHNFIANGIVAHNSLEQDADVVMFLYRDEVYDEQSPDKGVAEVIVAKHRNGPTGKAKLAFRGQYTRFDNMARSLPNQGPAPSSEGPPPEDF